MRLNLWVKTVTMPESGSGRSGVGSGVKTKHCG